jgi:hypothetical protein
VQVASTTLSTRPSKADLIGICKVKLEIIGGNVCSESGVPLLRMRSTIEAREILVLFDSLIRYS